MNLEQTWARRNQTWHFHMAGSHRNAACGAEPAPTGGAASYSVLKPKTTVDIVCKACEAIQERDIKMRRGLEKLAAMGGCECDVYLGFTCRMCVVRKIAKDALS